MSSEAPGDADSRAEQRRRVHARTAFSSWWILALALFWAGISSAQRHDKFFPPRGSAHWLGLPTFTKLAAYAPHVFLTLGCLFVALLVASRRSGFCHRLTHSLPAFIAACLVVLAIFAAIVRGLWNFLPLLERVTE